MHRAPSHAGRRPSATITQKVLASASHLFTQSSENATIVRRWVGEVQEIVDVKSIVPCGKREEIKLSKEELRQFWSLLEPNFVFWEYACDGTVPFVCLSMAQQGFSVTAYGDVQPCCYIPISFGTVRKDPLKVILDRMWRSSYFKQERTKHLDCPMNDENFRRKILKLTEGKHGYPVDYDESVFREEWS